MSIISLALVNVLESQIKILLPDYDEARGIGENVTFKQCVKGWIKYTHKVCRNLSQAVEGTLEKLWNETDMVHMWVTLCVCVQK